MSGWIHTLFRPLVTAAAAVALCAALLGCKTPYEEAYGRSYADHVAATIANPEAGKDNLEAPRPDGITADNAVYKARQRETETDQDEPPSVIDIDIGGGG